MRALLLVILLFTVNARADYPSAELNQHLCEEIDGEPWRLIPSTSWFCAAVDGQAFYRNLGTADFYHGAAHWTQLRTQISPAQDLYALNIRSIFYSGSSSNGYAEPTGNYHLFSFRGTWPEKILGAKWVTRVIDLDRQTVGAGLFVQEQESNGLISVLDWDSWQLMLRIESTGWFVIDDDVWNPEISFWEKRLGVGYLHFREVDDFGVRRDPYMYSYLDLVVNDWNLRAEGGYRNNTVAGLLGIGTYKYFGQLQIQALVEARTYGEGFAENIERQIEHQYISYDQYDKRFSNTMNIFVLDDNLDVYSSILNFKFALNHFHRFGFLNEVAHFAYKSLDPFTRYFYRAEYGYCPVTGREDCLYLFGSNKVLTQSYYRPPQFLSVENEFLFRERPYVGIEGHFSF